MIQDLFQNAFAQNGAINFQQINVTEERLQTKKNFQSLKEFCRVNGSLSTKIFTENSTSENSQTGKKYFVWHKVGKVIIRENAIKDFKEGKGKDLYIAQILMPNGAYYWCVEKCDNTIEASEMAFDDSEEE